MLFFFLYKVCLIFDIQRVDGNDVRMFVYKFGIFVFGDFVFLKQVVIIQFLDNNYFNNFISYVVLSKKFLFEVRGFVDIMEEIERDDIIQLINNWFN